MAPKAKKLKEDSPPLSSGNINLTRNIYSMLSKKEDGNIVFSPFSLEVALILTYIGANGNTEQEIRKALELPENKEEALQAVKTIVEALESCSEEFISIANGMFFDENHVENPIKKDFLNSSIKYFKALIEKLDFNKKKESADKINTFVETQTNKKITNVFDENSFPTDTRGFIINTVYFYAEWNNKFCASDTYRGDFHINEKEIVEVDMMWKYEYFHYYGNRNFDLVKLPYKGRSHEMVLIVPKKINGLDAIENQMKNMNLINLMERSSPSHVLLNLPKFKLNVETNLKDILQQLKINDLFDLEKADLKGISDEDGLHIHDIMQKCFLEVTEKGTEAAAMTRKILVGGGCFQGVTVTVDRPFLFFIYNYTAKLILFFGRVKKFE